VTDLSSLLGFDYVVNNNDALNGTWSRFQTPIVQYTTIDSDGYGEGTYHPLCRLLNDFFPLFLTWVPRRRSELNAIELRPPRMDDSGRTKYPVLFRVYADLSPRARRITLC
jgi:dipeptidyl aminopeptidase